MLKLFKKKEKRTVLTEEELFSCLAKDAIELRSDELAKARNKDDWTLYMIGERYRHQSEYVKALSWYRLAAAQNNSHAQFQAGLMYYNGNGVSQDYQQAMKWFLKAANTDGIKWAQWKIEEMCLDGLGVTGNIHAIIEWFTKAANIRHSEAQYCLGQIYEKYEEVKDLQRALYWYEKAWNCWDWRAMDCVTRLNKQGYFSKEDQKGVEHIAKEDQEDKKEEVSEVKRPGSSNEIGDRAYHSNSQKEQLFSTSQIRVNDLSQMEERMRKLDTFEQNKMKKEALQQERFLFREQMEIATGVLHQKINRLEQKNAKINEQQVKKDKENKRFRHHKAVLEDDPQNDLNYDSSINSSDNENENENDLNYDSEPENSVSAGDENDNNYDSTDNLKEWLFLE